MAELQLDDWFDSLARLGGEVSAIEGAVVDSDGHRRWHRAAGYRRGGEPLVAGLRFDAASLTKPFMATLALRLDALGTLPLQRRVGEVWPGADARLADQPLENLLRHRSGLPAWTPVGLRLGGRVGDRSALAQLLTVDEPRRERTPPGTYSDLGYLLWGLAVETVLGIDLGVALDHHLAAPLGLSPIGSLAAEPPDAVECRLDNGREVELAADQGFRQSPQAAHRIGRPQDANARLLGRLCGHAGLFLTLEELLTLGSEWLAPGRLLEAEAVARALAGEGGWALGWARSSPDGSSGPTLSASAFGHTGFTGGSLWIDPASGTVRALLAHRLNSRRDFNPIRRQFHALTA